MARNDRLTLSGVLLVYTNADITLYSFSNNVYTRKPIKGVFWEEVKQSNFLKSGVVNSDSVMIYIPLENITDDLVFTTGKDLIVYGIIDYEIDNTSQSTISTSLKFIKETYGFVTLTTCDKKLYGNRDMQHYELSCK